MREEQYRGSKVSCAYLTSVTSRSPRQSVAIDGVNACEIFSCLRLQKIVLQLEVLQMSQEEHKWKRQKLSCIGRLCERSSLCLYWEHQGLIRWDQRRHVCYQCCSQTKIAFLMLYLSQILPHQSSSSADFLAAKYDLASPNLTVTEKIPPCSFTYWPWNYSVLQTACPHKQLPITAGLT